MANIKRGDILRVHLDPVVGSEQAGERPVLVISPDIINARNPVIIVASLTTAKTDKVYATEALIEPPEGGLSHRSKVMLTQLRSIDKRRITGFYGGASEETMRYVEEALRVATGLTRF